MEHKALLRSAFLRGDRDGVPPRVVAPRPRQPLYHTHAFRDRVRRGRPACTVVGVVGPPAVLQRQWLHPFHREHRPREGVPPVGVPPRPRRPFDLPIRSEIVAGVVLVLVTVEDEGPGVEEALHQR